MHECTYTNQKHKKAKKWIDGFVQISGKSIVLYDEQRKRLYTTVSYKREDSEIDTPVYIIYSDELAAELDNGACPEAADEPSARVYERRQIAQSRITAAKPVVAEPFDYSAKQVEELEEETAERQDGPRPVGRSQEDILNLFSRK
ncbi:hypothetical protein PAPHI01_1141 [Pancytospora philotis]|nr:hypothetical protein PAPHI01_1141 [Pancytospora philotis]